MPEKISDKKVSSAQESFLKKLQVKRKKTRTPVIVAIVGIVGSGKSSVAKMIAQLIGGTVIEADIARMELGKQKVPYDRSRSMIENAALHVIKAGGNAIMDSDYIDSQKRSGINKTAKNAGAKLIYIRTVCDPDTMIKRMMTAKYNDGGFFKKGEVKIREMWRRTPNHYDWINKVGGEWHSKKLPFRIFATIDTTNPSKWKNEVKKIVKNI